MSDQPRLGGELILYRTANDAVRVEVLYESETFWLDQRRLAELFGVDVRTVSEHLRNVYDSGELNEAATLRKIRMVRTEGSREVARDLRDEQLNYRNMLGACLGGNWQPPHLQYCDTRKGGRDIQWNPAGAAHHVDTKLICLIAVTRRLQWRSPGVIR